MKKKCGIFVVEMLYFSKYLDLGLTFEKKFWTVFGLGLSLKNQDWIWIAKFGSPLISG